MLGSFLPGERNGVAKALGWNRVDPAGMKGMAFTKPFQR
jgi:hypothetical protein